VPVWPCRARIPTASHRSFAIGHSVLLDDVDVAVGGAEEEPTPVVALGTPGDVARPHDVSDEFDLRGGQFFTNRSTSFDASPRPRSTINPKIRRTSKYTIDKITEQSLRRASEVLEPHRYMRHLPRDNHPPAVRRCTCTSVKDPISDIETFINGWDGRCDGSSGPNPPPKSSMKQT
jgi:hypothetical protein